MFFSPTEIVDAKKVVISIQFKFTSLQCQNQSPLPGFLSNLGKSLVNGFVAAAISKCTQNSLRCVHTVFPHCDSHGTFNVNANISVEALSGHRIHNNTRDILNTIEKKKAEAEVQYYTTISMQSQTTAICNQPGIVSSGQYCGKCEQKY